MKRIHIILPDDLDTAIRKRLTDPLHGRIPKGELSGLVEMLLRKWLEEQNRTQRAALSQQQEKPA